MAARIRLIAIVHAFELQFLDKFLFFKQAETVVYRGQTDRGNLLARFAVDIKSAGMTLVIDEFGYDHQTLGGDFESSLPQTVNNGIFDVVGVNMFTP